MKTTVALLLVFLFSFVAFADGYSFEDDAPAGFIHLTRPLLESSQEPAHYFIPTASIVEISVSPGRQNDKGASFTEVVIRTSGSQTSRGGTTSLSYWFSFKSREEAFKFTHSLMRRIRGEQVGAGQPATRPESKPEGGDKPQPEADERSR